MEAKERRAKILRLLRSSSAPITGSELAQRMGVSRQIVVQDVALLRTGGSVIYGREAMQHLKKIGVVIYLKLSCESIAARLGDLRKRGITLREGQTLQQLYDERVPLYERYADITVDCENKSIREIVAEIVARLPK